MAKITSAEFKSYERKFFPLFVRLMDTPDFKSQNNEEQEKLRKLLGLTLNHIELGNICALWDALSVVEIGLGEDLSVIKSRVKEHIIARGNYNPDSPLTLAEFRERKDKA